MRTWISRALACVGALLLPFGARTACAYSPPGYPGSAWVRASRNFDGIEGSGTQGWVRQGVRWLRFRRLDIITYAGYSWRLRTKNRTFYDVYGPAVSVAFEGGPFAAGAEFSQLRYPELPDTQREADVFGTWFYSTELYRRPPDGGRRVPQALPLSTWGRVDTYPQGLEGTGSMGWVKQGVDWFSVAGWTFDTYGMYNWRLRTKNQTYYDAIGPSAGVAVTRDGLEVGVEYLWQRLTELRTTNKTFNLYLSWYYGWELSRPRPRRTRTLID